MLRRLLLCLPLLALAAAAWVVLRPGRRPAERGGSVTSEGSLEHLLRLSGRPAVSDADACIDFAPSTLATELLLVGGERFYPAILADLESARSSIHLLQHGFRPGAVAERFCAVIDRKVRQGVEVRISVDWEGRAVGSQSGAMLAALADAGAEVLVHSPLPLRDPRMPPQLRSAGAALSGVGTLDHRRLLVIDGLIGWIGGAGIDDRFADGRCLDVFARVEGDAVRQLQALCCATFLRRGGTLPAGRAGLAPLFPAPSAGGRHPAQVAQNVRSGALQATAQAEELIDGAVERLAIMNASLSDQRLIDRILNASLRGADVRLLVSAEGGNAAAQAALRHRYAELLDAGARIREHSAIVHGGLIVADDVVAVGTLKLDAWALYRNWEIQLAVESTAFAAEVWERLFDGLDAETTAGAAPDRDAERRRAALWSRLHYLV